jgi:hypothetical protein
MDKSGSGSGSGDRGGSAQFLTLLDTCATTATNHLILLRWEARISRITNEKINEKQKKTK